MSLTLLALVLIPVYMKMVLDPKGSLTIFKEVKRNKTVQMTWSLIFLVWSMMILSSTGLYFQWEWESLLAWLGLLIGIKGALFLVPGLWDKWTKLFVKEDKLPLLGFLGLVFVLFLVFVDTQLLV